MKPDAGVLGDLVAFYEPTGGTDAFGGQIEAWTERYVCAAQFRHASGDEKVQAGRLAGRQAFKVVIWSSTEARAITTAYQMRDARRGTVYNITDVDARTDRAWVWLVVEV